GWVAAARSGYFRLASTILSFSGLRSEAATSSSACEDAAGIAILSSPIGPWKGAPLRVLFTAEKPIDGELALIAPDGSVAAKSAGRYAGRAQFLHSRGPAPQPS